MKLLRSFLILTLVVLLSACNTATKVTKVQKWRGFFALLRCVKAKRKLEIPYEAS